MLHEHFSALVRIDLSPDKVNGSPNGVIFEERTIPERFGLPPEIKILAQQDKSILLAEIPVQLLVPAGAALSQSRIDALRKQMKRETQNQKYAGQLTPALVYEVMGTFHTVDGLHREDVHRANGDPTFYSTIYMGKTMKDVYKARIENTGEHSDLSFARSSDWMEKTWQLTPWSKKKVSLKKAFELLTVPGITGERLKLNSNDLAELKQWVVDISKEWKKTPGSIYQSLVLAEKADPDLVADARGGHVKGELSLAQLRAITQVLRADQDKDENPYSAEEKNKIYAIQKLIAAVAVAQGLTEAETRALSKAVAISQSEKDTEEILKKNWRIGIPQEETLFKRRHATKESSIHTLREELKLVTNEKKALEKELKKLRNELGKEQSENAISNSQTGNETKKAADYTQISKELESAKQRIEGLELKIKLLHHERDYLAAEKATLRTRYLEVAEEFDNLKKEKNSLKRSQDTGSSDRNKDKKVTVKNGHKSDETIYVDEKSEFDRFWKEYSPTIPGHEMPIAQRYFREGQNADIIHSAIYGSKLPFIYSVIGRINDEFRKYQGRAKRLKTTL